MATTQVVVELLEQLKGRLVNTGKELDTIVYLYEALEPVLKAIVLLKRE